MRPKTSLSSVCPAFSGGEVSSNKHPIQNLSVGPLPQGKSLSDQHSGQPPASIL